jgi:protein SCO1/2
MGNSTAISAFLSWLVVTVACHTDEKSQSFPIQGTVIEVGEERVVLDHDEIKGVMPAMVMELAVGSGELGQLRPGDRVEATLKMGDGPSRLEGVRVVGRKDLPAPPEKRWEASLLMGEVLEPVTVETKQGQVVVGAGQGQVTVLTFLFTRCPVPEFCPLLATKLSELQRKIAPARIVAVTLDPEHDTPELLAEYGARFGADPAVWTLGRLPREQLTALLARVDVDARVEAGTLTHNLRLMVLDAQGRLVHRESDNQWEVEAIAGKVQEAR